MITRVFRNLSVQIRCTFRHVPGVCNKNLNLNFERTAGVVEDGNFFGGYLVFRCVFIGDGKRAVCLVCYDLKAQ